jgi:Kef-type K+ transport system membrane component KefB/Trk K+ transport system NAD-binding subunit
MDHHSPYVPLLLITFLALIVPVLVSRMPFLRLPIVVGEILAGMIIGRSGLNLISPSPTLTFLAEFGFAFLMFLSGLEVSLDTLSTSSGRVEPRSPFWQRPIPMTLVSFSLTLFLAFIAGQILTMIGLARSPILLGLILSTTSLGIVMPILKERGLTRTSYGQLLLVSALVSDFVTLLLLSLAIAITSTGFTPNLLLFMVLLAAFVFLANISRRLTRIPLLTRIVEELSHATAQIRVRGSFALMVVFVVLAESLGIEMILGAFLAGAIVSVSSKEHESPLRMKLDAIGYGFFIPIFFINVGVQLDLRALLASHSALLLVPILILAGYVVKILPMLLYRLSFSWHETLGAGVLLSSRLSLIIAASAIALELGAITAATNSAIILMAIFTCTFSPLLFLRLNPQPPASRREGVIILGTDQLAKLLGQRVQQSGENVTFMGRDRQELENLAANGFRIALTDATDESALIKLGFDKVRALIAVSHSYPLVVSVCRLAVERFQIPAVIARADDRQQAEELRALKVRVVQPAIATALAFEAALHYPSVFEMMVDKSDDVDLVDAPLTNSTLVGRALRKVRLPGNALVLGIQRDGEVMVPHGDTVLQRRDLLMLVGSPDSLLEARRFLEVDTDEV